MMAPDLDYYFMLNVDKGFAFVLYRAINFSNSAEKALKDYIITFVSYAIS